MKIDWSIDLDKETQSECEECSPPTPPPPPDGLSIFVFAIKQRCFFVFLHALNVLLHFDQVRDKLSLHFASLVTSFGVV